MKDDKVETITREQLNELMKTAKDIHYWDNFKDDTVHSIAYVNGTKYFVK